MSEITINQVDVARLKVEPGEVLMVTVPGILSWEQADRLKKAFYSAFKESGGLVPTILVVDNRTIATVVRAKDVPPPPAPTTIRKGGTS